MSSEYIDPLGFLLDNSAALLKINQDLASSKLTSTNNSLSQKLTNKDSMTMISGRDDDADTSRDVCEFMSSVMSGGLKTQDESSEKPPTIGNEFVETISNIFDKLKISTVRIIFKPLF